MGLRKDSSNRSDEIRDRRKKSERSSLLTGRKTKSSVNPLKRTPKRATRRFEHSEPPVMVRMPNAASPKKNKRKQVKPRRRYDVSLGVEGAEMRLPSLPMFNVGWRLISAILVAALGFLLYQMWTSPNFRVEEVQIEGLQRIKEKQVLKVLDVYDQPVFVLSEARIAEDLLGLFPEFSSVSVEITLPDQVLLTVTERVPVLAWNQGGRLQLVDQDGMAFPVRDAEISLPAVVVEAHSSPPLLEHMALEETLDLAAIKSEGEEDERPAVTAFLKPETVSAILILAEKAPEGSPLVYEAEHGFGWTDPRGWQVYFGDSEQMQSKLSVYGAIIQRLQAEEVQPELVSVEHVHAPFYRVGQ